VFGQKAYNGVALISKTPIETVKKDILEEGIARTIQGHIGELTILNVYFPHGGFKGDDKFFTSLNSIKNEKLYREKQANGQ